MNDVVIELSVRAPASDVYAHFCDPDLLVRWIGVDATLDPRPGGVFRFELFPGEYCSGEYKELVPDSRVVFTWGWESGAMPVAPGSSTVEVELTPDGETTHIRLLHRDLPTDMRDMHRDGWHQFLARLTAVLERADVPADPAAPYADGRPPPGRSD